MEIAAFLFLIAVVAAVPFTLWFVLWGAVK